MYMWRRFDASVVEKDFQLLAKHGVNTLRIFPLWPDFQPVENQLVNHDRIYPLRNGDELFKNPAGLDEKQLENFGIVLDLAEKYIPTCEAMTTDDLVEAAKKYLDINNAVISVLKPKG